MRWLANSCLRARYSLLNSYSAKASWRSSAESSKAVRIGSYIVFWGLDSFLGLDSLGKDKLAWLIPFLEALASPDPTLVAWLFGDSFELVQLPHLQVCYIRAKQERISENLAWESNQGGRGKCSVSVDPANSNVVSCLLQEHRNWEVVTTSLMVNMMV